MRPVNNPPMVWMGAMENIERQQIVISGVGGQGVLFVTRLLAEAAIEAGLPVLTAETHGMAQRGGTVLSHLKVGDFCSPMIRPGQADGLLALREETLEAHEVFLKTDAWTAVNRTGTAAKIKRPVFAVDADRIALNIAQPRSVNLVMLGFAVACLAARQAPFFLMTAIEGVLQKRTAGKPGMYDAAMAALSAGRAAAEDLAGRQTAR